jgi:hypothetical protein
MHFIRTAGLTLYAKILLSTCMRKGTAKNKAYSPLGVKTGDEADRLIQAYLETFEKAPESDSLLKQYFFTMYFEKNYLQDNVFFIPRTDFLWFFKYYLGKEHERTERFIELKKRSACKDEQEIELVTIETRKFYTYEQGRADIIYTRYFADGSGKTYKMKNTVGAVALAKKLLADFQEDYCRV